MFLACIQVKASAAVEAIFAPGAFGRSVRVREALLLLMCDALRSSPPPAAELARACIKQLNVIIRSLDDGTSPAAQAALALVQAMYLAPGAAADLRAQLNSAR